MFQKTLSKHDQVCFSFKYLVIINTMVRTRTRASPNNETDGSDVRGPNHALSEADKMITAIYIS